MTIDKMIDILNRLDYDAKRTLELVVTRAVEPGEIKRIEFRDSLMPDFFHRDRIFIHEDDWKALKIPYFTPETPNIHAMLLGVRVIFDPTCSKPSDTQTFREG